MIGRVMNYDAKKGYGFIQASDSNSILVHFSNINMSGFKKLEVGQLVEYEIGFYLGRKTALNVTIVNNHITNGMRVNPNIKHDVEDKGYWCTIGSEEEREFVSKIVPKLKPKRNIIIHPKKENNPKHIDLLDVDRNVCADLKTQETPFFTAGIKYGFDPQYTVTFNHKDYVNYKRNYPNSIIYWWINWTQLTWRQLRVEPLYGVWEVPFDFMKRKIEMGQVPLHEYNQRINDKVNATDSYLFDLNWFQRILKESEK